MVRIRLWMIFAILVLITGWAVPASSSEVEFVPGQGPSIRVDGGWQVILRDGSTLFTHGPDPASPDKEPSSAAPAGNSTSVICVPSSEKHFGVIYAYPSSGPDRSLALVPLLRQAVYDASAFMDSEASAKAPGSRARYRVLCDSAGQVEVDTAVLPTRPDVDNFSTIASDLRAQGYNNPLAKYIVFYDGCPSDPCTAGGQGSVDWDDRASTRNRNNTGVDFGIHYAFRGPISTPEWSILLHESGHNMGAVQLSAPNSAGTDAAGRGFHCNDGLDIMCYADGGSKSNYSSTVCAVEAFDCNSDDYFNPAPAPKTYLARHWNLAANHNHYLHHR